MNLRLFTIAVLISALPSLTLAETSSLSESAITLNKGDFPSCQDSCRSRKFNAAGA